MRVFGRKARQPVLTDFAACSVVCCREELRAAGGQVRVEGVDGLRWQMPAERPMMGR